MGLIGTETYWDGFYRNLYHILIPSFFIFVTVSTFPSLNMLTIFGIFTVIAIIRSTYAADRWNYEFLLGYASGSLFLIIVFNYLAYEFGFDPTAITSMAVLGAFGVLLRRKGYFRYVRNGVLIPVWEDIKGMFTSNDPGSIKWK